LGVFMLMQFLIDVWTFFDVWLGIGHEIKLILIFSLKEDS
jgi:hypothetical protein